MQFTKNKFKSFDKYKKHKKCAEICKELFTNPINKDLLFHYNELLHWMGLPSFSFTSLNEIADQYHIHLKQTKLSLKEHNLLPFVTTQDKAPKKEFLKHAVFLDNLRSAFNVGNIVRTTEALRIGSLYFSKNTPYIDNDKVKKTSMGTYDLVPSFKDSNIDDLPTPIIVLETAKNALSIFDFIFPENFTLVLGNEEYGVSKEVLQKASFVVTIPLFGKKNSINVSAAYAIAASFIAKQKFYHA